MYSRPSSSTRREPRASRKKTGVPPTARNARTGEFTPPGISSHDRSNSSRLGSYIGGSITGWIEESRDRVRRGTHVRGAKDRPDYGHQVGARIDRFERVIRGDAADGDNRQARDFLRFAEQRKGCRDRARLGRRGKHASDRDIVGARIRGETRAARFVVAGHADDEATTLRASRAP